MTPRILIIDDDDFTAIYLEGVIGELYQIEHCAVAEQGVAAAIANPPALILMDVEMPGMNGYAACRLLKADAATREVPLIFLSARVETEDRLAGYEAGGDDYLTKPFDPDELRNKIEVLLRNVQRNRELASQAAYATSAALTAMAAAGETGVILRFLREMVGCIELETIARGVLRAMETFGRDASVQLRGTNEQLSLSREGICSPLEVAVLNNMAICNRIVDLGCRSAFNYPRVSLIVKNMPVDDPDAYGRAKDYLATIAEAADMQVQALDLIRAALDRGDHLLQLLQRHVDTLRKIEQRYREQRVASSQLLNELVQKIEDSFVFLGMTDAQELHLQKLVRDTVQHAQALYDQEIESDKLMQGISNDMGATLRQQLEQMAHSRAREAAVAPQSSGASDVELF